MKKLFVIFLLLNIIFTISYGKELWEKLKKNIFINYKTIVVDDNSVSGWFKIIEPQQQAYKLEKYKAYCAQKVIEVQHTKIFDNNSNLLEETINNSKVGCNYNGIINGKLYYKTLCKKKKF